MNVRYPMGVLHSFSIKNIVYDKTDLRLFYFDVAIFKMKFFVKIVSGSKILDVWLDSECNVALFDLQCNKEDSMFLCHFRMLKKC